MTRLEHTALIQRPLDEVYALAEKVDRYPDFLPGYLKSCVISRRGELLLLEREALIRGKVMKWRSWVSFHKPKCIEFEQAEGPLQGMKVAWRFESLSPQLTRLTIIHQFHIDRPLFIGRWLERWFFKPRVDEMAEQVVDAFKKTCERKKGVLV